MPLVDYGSSDESDSESPNEKEEVLNQADSSKDFSVDKVSSNETLSKETPEEIVSPEVQLFASLPTPKSIVTLGDNALKLLKSKNQPVKIMLPSLQELPEEVNEDSRKKRSSTKGSGLFALLPAPKHSNTLIPQSIQNKLSNIRKTSVLPAKKESFPTLKSGKSKTNKIDVDVEDDSEISPSSFFFTSDEDVSPNMVESEHFSGINQINPEVLCDVSHTAITAKDPPDFIIKSVGDIPTYSNQLLQSETVQVQGNSDIGNLDDEAIEKLCGTRARKRKGELSEEVIDINVESIVGEGYKWLAKDLTKEHEHRGFKKAKNLSVVERRKHQITYLASQAKEKEMELRNQWANSRMTRKQTQSKYGF